MASPIGAFQLNATQLPPSEGLDSKSEKAFQDAVKNVKNTKENHHHSRGQPGQMGAANKQVAPNQKSIMENEQQMWLQQRWEQEMKQVTNSGV